MEETIETNIEEQLPLDQNNSEAEIEELNKTLETLSDAIPDDEEKTEQLLDEEIKKDLASATKELEEQEEKKDKKQDNKDEEQSNKDEKQDNKDENKEKSSSIKIKSSKSKNVLEDDEEVSVKDKIVWTIIDKYFQDNENLLVSHHLDSYNSFINNGIKKIFREKNPITILQKQDPETKEYNYQAKIYFGGKDGSLIQFGKPIIFDETRQHYMFPNEARLRNMTYGTTIHYSIVIDYSIIDDDGKKQEFSSQIDNIFLGKFPIMLNSDLCILNSLQKDVKFFMGECRNDLGGYFIIDGKEKAVICQEKFADNMLYIRDKFNELYSHSAEIRSVSEDASKPIRTLSIRILSSTPTLTNNQILINVPNVKKPLPLFILMRALGIESDEQIIKYCLLDIKKNENYVDLFIPSIHDAGKIFSQNVALKYIATLTKGKTIPHVLEILSNYLLPHVGELNFVDKAYFIGHMVFELLKVYKKEKPATDRDSFKFKRIELTGSLLYDLFKEYYTLQQKNIFLKIDKEYHYKQQIYENNFTALIENNYREIFKERLVETGFRKALKGNWGAEDHTKKQGVVQPLNRLSFNSFMSHLRKISLPLDSSAKVVGPRLLHGSHWGIIDPVDTPDGGNIGLHKHMAMGAHITSGCSAIELIEFLRKTIYVEKLYECTPEYISNNTKVIVNGQWIGVISEPETSINLLKNYRRNGLIPIYTSVSWEIQTNTLFIYTDSGRLCRPIFYIKDNNEPSYYGDILKKIKNGDFTWSELLFGYNSRKDDFKNYFENIHKNNELSCKLYDKIDDIYLINNIKELEKKQGIIDYVDTAETETLLICDDEKNLNKYFNLYKKILFTNIEIHPSLYLGVMGNQIVFPENNQLPRDLFSCGQSKQAVSLYNSNYQNRIDKLGVVLNNGQIPLVKSRYMKYINNEQHPYGENAIVAIGVYGSYNVEDSILFNEGSVKRGLFRITYYNDYEAYEESSKVGKNVIDTKFASIDKENVVGKKPGYEYDHLDEYGLIKENTPMSDKKVVIGKVTTNLNRSDTYLDSSVYPKKGQLGYVDKTFITDGEEGFRIAKVRVREERYPAIGDKFCSRCGQKGTVGLVIPEESMPFTEEGIRPDLIINPHALPSRMTIGQLIETLMGKTCSQYGGFGDCTAFSNNGPKEKVFGELLQSMGYHSSGNEILYNGETGEQLSAQMFIGPVYYMRLKHMVKDKINYRARGPRTVLTRQPLQGRANDGGLRIGEMERDAMIAYGATKFLQESLLDRGDNYYMAVCNKSGCIAIYNEKNNLFMSPFVNGPIKFTGSIDNDLNIENVTKFGRSFSVVRVPYSLKLLIQELQTINVQMRIITDANVSQLDNLNFKKSINFNVTQNNIDELIRKNSEKIEINKSVKESIQQNSSNNETDFDPNDEGNDDDLNPITREAIAKAEKEAEEYYSSQAEDFSDEDDEETSKPPISIGKDIQLDDVINLDDNSDPSIEQPNPEPSKKISFIDEQQLQQPIQITAQQPIQIITQPSPNNPTSQSIKINESALKKTQEQEQDLEIPQELSIKKPESTVKSNESILDVEEEVKDENDESTNQTEKKTIKFDL
tara:strand:+ start:1447 stop:6183 length:4737 start_codon:yes stop_codon:yes gene_type:complete